MESDLADFDVERTFGRIVTFDGPDTEDTISFSPATNTADMVYDAGKGGAFLSEAEAGGSGLIAVDNLGPRAFCVSDFPSDTRYHVMCVAAFDGMAVTGESTNYGSGKRTVESAVALLRAGVEHWKAIRD